MLVINDISRKKKDCKISSRSKRFGYGKMDWHLQGTPTTFIASFILLFICSLNNNLQHRFNPRCFWTEACFTLDLLNKSEG